MDQASAARKIEIIQQELEKGGRQNEARRVRVDQVLSKLNFGEYNPGRAVLEAIAIMDEARDL